MILLRYFNRKFTIIRLDRFGNPKAARLVELELPRGSILHYVPNSATEEGPAQTLPILSKAEKLIYVRHVHEYTDIIGRPRRVNSIDVRNLTKYHQANKRVKRLVNDDAQIVKDPRTMLVESYCQLTRRYNYTETPMSWYEKWHNTYKTVFDTMAADASRYTDRQNYFVLPVPTTIPAIADLKRAESKRTTSTLRPFQIAGSDQLLVFLELWTWLGDNRKDSMLDRFDKDQLSRINFILQTNTGFINMNLGELDSWRRDGKSGLVKPQQMQYRLLNTAINLLTQQPMSTAQLPKDIPAAEYIGALSAKRDNLDSTTNITIAPDDENEDVVMDEEAIAADIAKYDAEPVAADEVFSLVETVTESTVNPQQDIDKPITYATGIAKACERVAASGTLTKKEQQFFDKLVAEFESLPSPYSDEKIGEFIKIDPKMIVVEPKKLLDDVVLLTPAMAESTTLDMDSKYNTVVLPKDVVGAVAAIQRAGIGISEFTAEPVVDATNNLMLHTVKVHPVGGVPSTLRFTLPIIDDRGYWLANDVEYTMRKQRVDLPIRKIAPDCVALTTFYGKNFVQRCDKATSDYSGWLTKNIRLIGNDPADVKITKLKYSNVFNPNYKLPFDYTSVASKFSGFTAGGVEYNFDISAVESFFGADAVAECNAAKLTPVGRAARQLLAMDINSILYRKGAKGFEPIGTLVDVLGLDTDKMPNEYTELSFMGKSLPLGLIFGYYYGFEPSMRLFDIPYRTLLPTEQYAPAKGELVIKCVDAKVVVSPANREQMLLVNGWRPYLKIARMFSLKDLNKPDVYYNLIQRDGLSAAYLNELDLMSDMFVDDIAKRMLEARNEPTTFRGLLRLANTLLVHDQSLGETDADEMHLFGNQRLAGAVYTELVRSIRRYRNTPGSRKKIDMHVNAVWNQISEDPSVATSSDANPIHSIKEMDVVTFGGHGGRSRRSMTKDTRQYTRSDLGLISGDTVDNGDAGITAYLPSNPTIATVDGVKAKVPTETLNASNLYSTPVALSPCAMYDSPKRKNFIGIHHGSGISAVGYTCTSLRTGEERLIAHKTKSTHANIAPQPGVVESIDSTEIVIKYKDGNVVRYPLGREFTRHEGGCYPQTLKTVLKLGDKVNERDVVTYNAAYFKPAPDNPRQVDWMAGVMATVALLESTDTFEDSCAISPALADKLATHICKVKPISVRFDQAIHNLVKVGQSVDPSTILCTIEDSLTATSNVYSDHSLDTLASISAKTPEAKVKGVVEKIEVYYNGDYEDMSESVLSIVKADDKRRAAAAKVAKANGKLVASSGLVDSTNRINGIPVELDTVVIRLYITHAVDTVGGDKAEFSSQLKTTVRRVMVGKNTTIDGVPLDGLFGKKSVDEREVLSTLKIGTTNTLGRLASQRVCELLGIS